MKNTVSKIFNLSIGYIETSARMSKLRSMVSLMHPIPNVKCYTLIVMRVSNVNTLLMHYSALTNHEAHFRGYGVSWIAIYWTGMLYLLKELIVLF